MVIEMRVALMLIPSKEVVITLITFYSMAEYFHDIFSKYHERTDKITTIL